VAQAEATGGAAAHVALAVVTELVTARRAHHMPHVTPQAWSTKISPGPRINIIQEMDKFYINMCKIVQRLKKIRCILHLHRTLSKDPFFQARNAYVCTILVFK
jgi:uncharacterized protein (DUF1810 family)